jgi:hypothetical protein
VSRANETDRAGQDGRRSFRWPFVAVALIGAFISVAFEEWAAAIVMIIVAIGIAVWALLS